MFNVKAMRHRSNSHGFVFRPFVKSSVCCLEVLRVCDATRKYPKTSENAKVSYQFGVVSCSSAAQLVN